jgi:hypothetical protein
MGTAQYFQLHPLFGEKELVATTEHGKKAFAVLRYGQKS